MDLSARAAAVAEDDSAAPDSWEMADLDEAMSRLMVFTKNDNAACRDFGQETAGDAKLSTGTSRRGSPDAREVGGGGYNDCDVPGSVDPFLREALEKPRERLSILRMEQDIEKFLRNSNQQELEFQGLPTSYLRLAAHRVAQHYSLQSSAFPDGNNSDGSGSRIVLRKTIESRLPAVRLADIPVSLPREESSDVVKVAIKQRPQHRLNNFSTSNVHSSKTSSQKSVEERKEEYNRARARIFSNNDGGAVEFKLVGELKGEKKAPDYVQHCSFSHGQLEEKCVSDGLELNFGRSSADDSSSSSRTDREWAERDPIASRFRTSNRVAIFRDREVDRKDPDYDRNYDRYMQRFDPGFGFNNGSYAIQPMYSPAVNYNTEFPQLGTSRRSPISADRQPHPNLQHLRAPWPIAGSSSSSPPIGYGLTDGMVAPFNPNHTVARATSMFVQSQFAAANPRGIPFVHSRGHVQPFPQTHQEHSDSSFGLARPR